MNKQSQQEKAKNWAELQTSNDLNVFSSWTNWYALQDKASGGICVVNWNIMTQTFEFNNNPGRKVIRNLGLVR